MDKSEFDKRFAEFSKGFNEAFGYDGKRPHFDMSQAGAFFQDLFSLADEINRINKERFKKKASFPSQENIGEHDRVSRLYAAVQKEFQDVLEREFSNDTDGIYPYLLDKALFDKHFNIFYSRFFSSLIQSIKAYLPEMIEDAKKVKTEKELNRVLPLANLEAAVIAVLNGKLVIDSSMPKDGSVFYSYLDGAFYRVVSGERPVVVDMTKLKDKEFFVLNR